MYPLDGLITFSCSCFSLSAAHSETKSVADPVNIRCGLELICAPLLSVLAVNHRALREINEGFDLVLL